MNTDGIIGAATEKLDFADIWLASFKRAIEEAGLKWYDPHVVKNEEISFEWWRDERTLAIFIRNNSIEAIKIWGSSIYNEMLTVSIANAIEAVAIWQWLRGDEKLNQEGRV